MHKHFVHVAAGLSMGVLFFATSAAVANPVTVDVSFSGTEQTAMWEQSIPPGSFLELSTTGVFLGSPFVSDPNPQTDPVTHAGGTTFVTANPVSLTDDGVPVGTDGPTPVTTQMSFGAYDWQLQDVNNLHLDLLAGTSIASDWNQINHEISLGGLPGSLKLDLFHETFEWLIRQVGGPTIGTDGSFSIPVNIGTFFQATSEALRPTAMSSVHGAGTTTLTVDDAPFLIGAPDVFPFLGQVTTTTMGDAFGVGATPGVRDVLVELDGSFAFDFPFDSVTSFAEAFSATLGATGSLTLGNTIHLAATWHLEKLLLDVHRLKGDISGDGEVDIGDFTLWADAFGDTGDGSQPEDITMDGEVDIGDFTSWADQFGATSNGPGGGGGASAVPEPSSLVLLCIGVVGLATYGWRRRRKSA